LLLRRISEHVKDQNWFAVGIDFIIVVVGIVIGLQAQQWLVEHGRRLSEQQYLDRLHNDVSQLLSTRNIYDATRQQVLTFGQTALDQLGSEMGLVDAPACTGIAASANTTIPPAALPTATELLSAGNLDAIRSEGVRAALLFFMQEAARAETLIKAQSDSNRDLTRDYPDLFHLNYGPPPDFLGSPDGTWTNPSCETEAMRDNHAFVVDLTENVYIYDVYTNRAVLPVSAALRGLHAQLDEELDFIHPETGAGE
jgi:hypothetical protein